MQVLPRGLTDQPIRNTRTPVFTRTSCQGVQIQAIAASGSLFSLQDSTAPFTFHRSRRPMTALAGDWHSWPTALRSRQSGFAATREPYFHSPNGGCQWDVLNNAHSLHLPTSCKEKNLRRSYIFRIGYPTMVSHGRSAQRGSRIVSIALRWRIFYPGRLAGGASSIQSIDVALHGIYK